MSFGDGNLHDEVDRLKSERGEIAELVGWRGEVDGNGGRPLLVEMVAAMCEGARVAGELQERVDSLETTNGKLCAEINRQERRIRELEALVRDMFGMLVCACEWDVLDGIDERMRELGIEAD